MQLFMPDSLPLEPQRIKQIRGLAQELFDGNEGKRSAQIDLIVNKLDRGLQGDVPQEDLAASIAVFFEAAFENMLSCTREQNNQLYSFFVVLNHLPVLESSPFYDMTLEILYGHFQKNTHAIKLFDRLQLLYLYTEIGYTEAARKSIRELDESIDRDNLSFFALLQLCKYRAADCNDDNSRTMRRFLHFALLIWDYAGTDATLFLMLYWLSSQSWFKKEIYYKLLLENIYSKIYRQNCLNAAFVGYELFSLEDKRISPQQKINYCLDLIQDQKTALNSMQLNSLYFFAGNYLSGLKEQFRDSIQFYKDSNYYLHKCWERLIGISKYLRVHSSSADYKLSMHLLEDKFMQLSNQTSLRNSSYVDNLQANFDTITQLYREVGELSLTDALTGQRNRRYMDNNLPQIVALAARQQAPVSFIMMDVDNFKEINDEYGHAAGDVVLQGLAKILGSEFRKSDILIRYGGDEFLAVLFNSGIEQCHQIMENLREKIESASFAYKTLNLKITISIGINSELFDSKTAMRPIDEFIQKADLALYQAKEAGRNMIKIYRTSEIPA